MARTRARTERSALAALPDTLTDPRCYGRGVREVRRVETHVSWVFLTGQYAYKIKKPVKLPFVDFSTARLRKHFCDEELRVNRRLAPDLYLGVVPIGGTPSKPRIGRRPAFEHAVKMREFAAADRLDKRLEAGKLPKGALADFGAALAAFHAGLPPVRNAPAEEAAASAVRNVEELAGYLDDNARRELEPLRDWTKRRAAALQAMFARRARGGSHRECHGDLHLQNLLWRNGKIMAFDALEFDRKLRDIDVVSEAAFLAMDLHAHGERGRGYEFLSRYFEAGGDYEGVDVLPFYLVYRALVRAKVAAIKSAQSQGDGHDAERYLDTALELVAPTKPVLVITRGLSGSGKTFVTEDLITHLPAIRVRSDVERKRLHGLAATARTGSAVGAGLYGATGTRRTYDRLARIADTLLRNGQNAIVDATFLKRSERREFAQVAAYHAARFVILDCVASPNDLRRRIRAREERGRDASEAGLAVLEHQLRTQESLTPAERRHAVTVDTERAIRHADLGARLRG